MNVEKQVFIWQANHHRKSKKPQQDDGTYSDFLISETTTLAEWEYNGSIAQSRDKLVQPGAFFVKQDSMGDRILVGKVLIAEPLAPLHAGTKRFRLVIDKEVPITSFTKEGLVDAMGFRHIKGNEKMYGMSVAIRK